MADPMNVGGKSSIRSSFENDSSVLLQESFDAAAKELQNHISKLSSEQLLFFYARYKQTFNGPCNTSKPSLLDFQGKQKWTAWKNLGSMTSDQAMREYIEELRRIFPEWDTKPQSSAIKSKTTFGPVHSVMANCDAPLKENEKTAFDYVKDCDIEKLKQTLKSENINGKDENGMTLLHWASDRSYIDIVRLLLDQGANINTQDNEGQTALHYAYSCEHQEVIDLLLIQGADTTICDFDGNQVNTD